MGSGNFTVKTNKIPLPTIAPDDYSSGVFCIQLSPEWYWIWQGLTEMLNIRALWKWTTDEQWEQIREWLARLAALERDCMAENCCPMRFNLTLGTIQIFEGGEWVDIPDTDKLLAGAAVNQVGGTFSFQFNQGGDTLNLDIDVTEQNVNFQTPPPDPSKTDQERACAIAENLIEWVMESYQDALDAYEAASDVFAAIDGLLAIIPPAYLIVDQILDFMNEISEATVNEARAHDTVGLRQRWKDELYCRIVENDYEFTMQLWLQFEEDIVSAEFFTIALWVKKVLSKDGIIDQANRASYELSSGCATVNCNCFTFYSVGRNAIGYGENRHGTIPDPITAEFIFQEKYGIDLGVDLGWYRSEPAGTVVVSSVARCFSELGGIYAISKLVDIDRIKVQTANSTTPNAAGTFGNMTIFTSAFNTNWQRPYFAGYTFNSYTNETEIVLNAIATNVELLLLSMSERVQNSSTPCDGRYVQWEARITEIRARPAGTAQPFTWTPLNDRTCL